jgi:hypothetical protein
MTRLLVVDHFFCRVQRPRYGAAAALKLDDESVRSDESDSVGWLTRLGPSSEELRRSSRVPAIAGQDHARFWSQSP